MLIILLFSLLFYLIFVQYVSHLCCKYCIHWFGLKVAIVCFGCVMHCPEGKWIFYCTHLCFFVDCAHIDILLWKNWYPRNKNIIIHIFYGRPYVHWNRTVNFLPVFHISHMSILVLGNRWLSTQDRGASRTASPPWETVREASTLNLWMPSRIRDWVESWLRRCEDGSWN